MAFGIKNFKLIAITVYIADEVDMDDEYATAGVKDPKILLTTARDPSSRLAQFAKVGLIYLKRGGARAFNGFVLPTAPMPIYLACVNTDFNSTLYQMLPVFRKCGSSSQMPQGLIAAVPSCAKWQKHVVRMIIQI